MPHMEAIKPIILEVVSVYKARQCTIVVKRIENGARIVANNRNISSRIEVYNDKLANLYLAHKPTGRIHYQNEITLDGLRHCLNL